MDTVLISIAPMMEYTDRHCRYLLRLLSKRMRLYTEMVTTGALLHGDVARHLTYDVSEHPLALQLGGSDPVALARCAQLATEWGYDEINLNVGCPSNRVQRGRFGACLMKEPARVADCVAAMGEVSDCPITVKTRIGVDDYDDYAFLYNFINKVSRAGCNVFIIHARKAWLQGLSPKQNREIPPLQYERIQQLKQDFPSLTFIVNGGVTNSDQMRKHLAYSDGVMLGRGAYHNLYWVAECAHEFLGEYAAGLPSRWSIIQQYADYMQRQMQQGVPLWVMLRHLLGLFHAVPNAKTWRRYLTQQAASNPHNLAFLLQAPCDVVEA